MRQAARVRERTALELGSALHDLPTNPALSSPHTPDLPANRESGPGAGRRGLNNHALRPSRPANRLRAAPLLGWGVWWWGPNGRNRGFEGSTADP